MYGRPFYEKIKLGLGAVLLSLACFASAETPSSVNQPSQQERDIYNLANRFAQAGSSNLAGDVVGGATSAVNSSAAGVTKSYLERYFPTVELQLDLFDYNKTQSGVLILAPLWENDKNLIFTQDSAYHKDNRTTVNVGLGYRRLEMDKKLLLGVNTFYDYEFPYGNTRSSLGLEARATVGELNFNRYWGISGWKDATAGYQERSLGGTDIELGVPLPYANWAKVYARGFVWYGVDGVGDLRGNDVSLRAQVPVLPGLAVEAGHRNYNGSTPDENFIRLTYNLTDLVKANKTEPWISESAYSLGSMEGRKYDKVRRENIIVKQRRSKTGASSCDGLCFKVKGIIR